MSEFNDPNLENHQNGPEVWDEFRWEEFMKESDKRSEKYAELLQKYLDHPDRDIIIAREMGWDWLLEALENDEMEDEEEDELHLYDEDTEEGEGWKQAANYLSDEFDEVENLRVYQIAFSFGLDATNLVRAQTLQGMDESLSSFLESATIPAAKIAGGFSMGFEMDSLGGNIANCKRGLASANTALEALREMKDKDLISQKEYLDYYNRAKEVRDELGIYIVELREQFRQGTS